MFAESAQGFAYCSWCEITEVRDAEVKEEKSPIDVDCFQELIPQCLSEGSVHISCSAKAWWTGKYPLLSPSVVAEEDLDHANWMMLFENQTARNFNLLKRIMNDTGEIQCQFLAKCPFSVTATGSTAHQQALNAYYEAFTNFNLLSGLSLKQCAVGNQRGRTMPMQKAKPSHTCVY